MKKRILFVTEAFEVGGVAACLQQYSFIASKLGLKPIILGGLENLQTSNFFHEDCELIFLPLQRASGVKHRMKSMIFFLAKLHQIFLDHDIEVVHISLTWAWFYSALHPLFWMKKKIITFHGAYDLESKHYIDEIPDKEVIYKKIQYAKQFLRKNLQALSLLLSDEVIVNSEYAKELIVKHFSFKLKEKITIIPGFLLSPAKSIHRSTDKSELRLINYGRLEIRKGIDTLFGTVKYLREKQFPVKLYLAAPSHISETIRFFSIYEELDLFTSVHFLHKASQREKEQLLGFADVFIFPSKDFETFGMTMLEALSVGVPVIGTPAGAIPEVLSKIDNRFIAKSISAEDLAERVIWYSRLEDREKKILEKKTIELLNKDYYYTKFLSVFSKLYSVKGYQHS